MSFTRKIDQNELSITKNKPFRNPLKNRMNDYFKDDLKLDNINPFSQQLTPWNNSTRLQASINLVKQQMEKQLTLPNHNQKNINNLNQLPSSPTSTLNQIHQRNQISVENIVTHDSLQYVNLAYRDLSYSNQKQKHNHNHNYNHINQLIQHDGSDKYFYPKLKINSTQVVVSKNQKERSKRLLFTTTTKTPHNQDKNFKKIANLTMQWDQDIVYNPQRKFIQEQNLKRKILRQFPSHIIQKDQSPQIISSTTSKMLKNQNKMFKLQFKNNKIHRKQVSIYEFKRKQNNSLQFDNRLGDKVEKDSLEINLLKNDQERRFGGRNGQQDNHSGDLSRFLSITNNLNKLNMLKQQSDKIMQNQNQHLIINNNNTMNDLSTTHRTLSPQSSIRYSNNNNNKYEKDNGEYRQCQSPMLRNRFRSDKWRFRTSLKAKRSAVSPQKGSFVRTIDAGCYNNNRQAPKHMERGIEGNSHNMDLISSTNNQFLSSYQTNCKHVSHTPQALLAKQKQILNKITISLHKDFQEQLPIQIFTKTTPNFFSKKNGLVVVGGVRQ